MVVCSPETKPLFPSSFLPPRCAPLGEKRFITTGAQGGHLGPLVAGGRGGCWWKRLFCLCRFFPMEKTIEELEMIWNDWGWNWILGGIESISNYLPRVVPKWFWVVHLDFHDIQGVNFPDVFLQTEFTCVSVYHHSWPEWKKLLAKIMSKFKRKTYIKFPSPHPIFFDLNSAALHLSGANK